MDFEAIFEFLSRPIVTFLLASVFIVIIIISLFRMVRLKSIKKEIEQVEVSYNDLISIPVLFKINKANGLAKTNPAVLKEFEKCKDDYSKISAAQEAIASLLADCEDSVAFGKLKLARQQIEELSATIAHTKRMTYTLDQELDVLLEQETAQRLKITELKNMFRKVRDEVIKNEVKLSDSYTYINQQVSETEALFSSFEEWMFASDFDRAKDISDDITERIAIIEEKTRRIPQLYSMAKGYIPQLLDEISKLYQGLRQKGVYVEHLEVPKNIGVFTEVLKEDLISIHGGETERSYENLADSQKKLEQLIVDLQQEEKALEELNAYSENAYETLDALMASIAEMLHDAPQIEERFDFEGFKEEIVSYDSRVKELDKVRLNIVQLIAQGQRPATQSLIAVHELSQSVEGLNREYQVLHEKIEQANADEIRAKKQLLKLYIIINEVQVRIKKRSLPSISEKYDNDLKKALIYADQIKSILNQTVLDVSLLNATVDEAIDYTYRLHNNVENLVGVVDMCENSIVYANKFRAYIPEIDTEITKAELSFSNGEYTHCLNTVINAIDKYRSVEGYEELIRENARSAR